MDKPDSESPKNLTSALHVATKGALKAQSDLAQAFVDAMNGIQGMPKPALEALEKFHAAGIKLRKTQEGLVDSYFDLLKKFDPTGSLGAKAGAPLKMVQDLAAKAVKTQVSLIQKFGGAVSGVVGTVASKLPKKK